MSKQLEEGEHIDLDSGATIERMRGNPDTYCLRKYNNAEGRDEYVFVSEDDIRQFAELAGYEVRD